MRAQVYRGVLLAGSFVGVLVFIVMIPTFEGKNFIEYADMQFDSYAKHSSYFIPEISAGAEKLQSKISVELDMKSEETARKTALLYANFAEQKGNKISVNGELGKILLLALRDAEKGYRNDNAYFERNYGISAKEALYLWHLSLSSIVKELEKEQRFEESLFIKTQVLMRAIEPAYNFYGVEAKPIDLVGGALLIFYVVYTLWWGFAIYFLFEGMGIKITKPKSKKEV